MQVASLQAVNFNKLSVDLKCDSYKTKGLRGAAAGQRDSILVDALA